MKILLSSDILSLVFESVKPDDSGEEVWASCVGTSASMWFPFELFFLERVLSLPRMAGSGDSSHSRNFCRPSSSGNAFTTSIALTIPIPLHKWQHVISKRLYKYRIMRGYSFFQHGFKIIFILNKRTPIWSYVALASFVKYLFTTWFRCDN